jgi:hypothetical protein
MKMTINGEISGSFKWNSYAVARVGFRTNGYMVGDGGSFVTITIRNDASTNLSVSVNGGPETQVFNTLTLTFRGGDEFHLALETFQFLAKKLGEVQALSSGDYTAEYGVPEAREPETMEFDPLPSRVTQAAPTSCVRPPHPFGHS